MLRTDLVLSDECAVFGLSACPDAKAKAGHVVVKLDMFGFDGGNIEARDCRFRELHGPPSFWEESGKIETVFPSLPMSLCGSV